MSLDSYQIIDAKIEDLNRIVEIYNSTISSRMVTADLNPVDVKSKEPWFLEHNSTSRPLWVVKDQDYICGWLSFQSFYGRPAYNKTAEISIYLDPSYRGKGLGKELLEYAICACPKLGIKTILGFIFGHNLPSLHLFQQFQFEKWAHFPKVAELDGVERDLIILGKRVEK
ncbi:GNAT family N-acetyltransferase [Alkalihalobacillus trypoxylicola]|uniref:Phosphinothricin acetyltransferase n=1 Tax=Alkalihalobacillus trypoxylicola TaxID=519424 RepID=A0A161P436_9BACI|nr:GNAT family N-acetyltransferase [Alkalihalobacillus trypoxylicola]KYG26575.1 phosphinothricin acetyltransferase [Alkalihalobacillus trypoxylicola]GAF64827.1 phosphinothricin acetyltransferase [Bacillus sp. TS-2]